MDAALAALQNSLMDQAAAADARLAQEQADAQEQVRQLPNAWLPLPLAAHVQ